PRGHGGAEAGEVGEGERVARVQSGGAVFGHLGFLDGQGLHRPVGGIRDTEVDLRGGAGGIGGLGRGPSLGHIHVQHRRHHQGGGGRRLIRGGVGGRGGGGVGELVAARVLVRRGLQRGGDGHAGA